MIGFSDKKLLQYWFEIWACFRCLFLFTWAQIVLFGVNLLAHLRYVRLTTSVVYKLYYEHDLRIRSSLKAEGLLVIDSLVLLTG